MNKKGIWLEKTKFFFLVFFKEKCIFGKKISQWKKK